MILPVLVFALNFVFTWVIPIACVCVCACACNCACVASENQVLVFGLGAVFKSPRHLENIHGNVETFQRRNNRAHG